MAFVGTINSDVQFRNRVFNGAMEIDQRSDGANTAVSASAPYTLDRFRVQCANHSGTMNVRQDSTSTTGFVNSLRTIVTAANTSMPSGGLTRVFTSLEGTSISDLGWGTANAKTVTLSFYARSSNTGTFSGSITNYAEDRSYPFTYTINTANNWEYETITIAGDTSGTWPTSNAGALVINFDLGSGSTQYGTANAWTGSFKTGVTGSTSIMGTVGNNWYVTGIQLEPGSTATPFEHRPYGMELQLCQRYFWTSVSVGGDQNPRISSGIAYSAAATAQHAVMYPVEMRATPTINSLSGNHIYSPVIGGKTITSVSLVGASRTGTTLSTAGSAGLTNHDNWVIFNCTLNFSAEL